MISIDKRICCNNHIKNLQKSVLVKNDYMQIYIIVVENLEFYTFTLSTSFNSFLPKCYQIYRR